MEGIKRRNKKKQETRKKNHEIGDRRPKQPGLPRHGKGSQSVSWNLREGKGHVLNLGHSKCLLKNGMEPWKPEGDTSMAD